MFRLNAGRYHLAEEILQRFNVTFVVFISPWSHLPMLYTRFTVHDKSIHIIKCAVFSIHTLRQAKFIRFSFTPHAHDSCSCRTVSEARSGRAGDVRLMSERDDSTLYGSSWLQNARVRSTACRSV